VIEITDTEELGLVVPHSDAVFDCDLKEVAVPSEALAVAVEDFVIADVALPSSESVGLELVVDVLVTTAERVALAV